MPPGRKPPRLFEARDAIRLALALLQLLHFPSCEDGSSETSPGFSANLPIMSGKRLLDAIQLFNVAKSVAVKHLEVRQRQLDLFTRTSSLTKGIKSQADGLCMTAQAAAALAKRFNDDPSPPQSASAPPPRSPSSSPTHTNLSPDEGRKAQRQAESQIPSSTAETTGYGASQLDVSQQQDVFYEPSTHTTPGSSGLPRVKLPKTSSDTQTGINTEINADVFHSPVGAEKAASTTQPTEQQEEISEDMMKEIFHSPKVARMLSRQAAADLRYKGRSPTPPPDVKPIGKEGLSKEEAEVVDEIVSTTAVSASSRKQPEVYI